MAKAESIVADSAPRRTNSALEIANGLNLIALNIELMKAAGCPLRTAPFTGGEYIVNAMNCQTSLLQQSVDHTRIGILPACDQSKWGRVRVGAAAPGPSTIQPSSEGVPSLPTLETGTLTLAKYQQILEGMTYDQVVALVGTPGVGPISTTDGTSTSEVYVWSNGGSTAKVKVAFQDGKVVWTTQFKLE